LLTSLGYPSCCTSRAGAFRRPVPPLSPIKRLWTMSVPLTGLFRGSEAQHILPSVKQTRLGVIYYCLLSTLFFSLHISKHFFHFPLPPFLKVLVLFVLSLTPLRTSPHSTFVFLSPPLESSNCIKYQPSISTLPYPRIQQLHCLSILSTPPPLFIRFLGGRFLVHVQTILVFTFL
jgi:hypothetical protein